MANAFEDDMKSDSQKVFVRLAKSILNDRSDEEIVDEASDHDIAAGQDDCGVWTLTKGDWTHNGPDKFELVETKADKACSEWATEGLTLASADLKMVQLIEDVKERHKLTLTKAHLRDKLGHAIQRLRAMEQIRAVADPFSAIGDPMQRFAVVPVGGATRVYDRTKKVYFRRREFEDLFAHIAAPADIERSYGQWWFENPERPSYLNGVSMLVNETVPEGVLNLWQGMGCVAKEGDWSQFKAHLMDTICSGNQKDYDYLIRWTAWVIQNPGKPAETVIVLRGGQGTGKGLVNQVMTKIMNHEHSFECSSSTSMTGSFTAWMRGCLWLFVDEAFFAGGKAGMGRLKSLITEKRISVNQKGIDEVMVDNLMSIMMGANGEWVIHVDWDDRRFFVLDVSGEHAKDKKYFNPLWKQLFREGGVEAFYHDMMEVELGDWHPREIHTTEAKRRQLGYSLTPAQKWLFHILKTAEFKLVDDAVGRAAAINDKQGNLDAMATWLAGHIIVDTTAITRSFETYNYGSHEGAERRKTSANTAGQLLSTLGLAGSKPINGRRERELPALGVLREIAANKIFDCTWGEYLTLIEKKS